jgi:hypothetical protein
MNVAILEPSVSKMRPTKTTVMMMLGSSQYFLCSRMTRHNLLKTGSIETPQNRLLCVGADMTSPR